MKKLILIISVFTFAFANVVSAQTAWAVMTQPVEENLLTITYCDQEAFVFGTELGFRWETEVNDWKALEVYDNSTLSLSGEGYVMIAGPDMLPVVCFEPYNYLASIYITEAGVKDLFSYQDKTVILQKDQAYLYSPEQMIELPLLANKIAEKGFSIDSNIYVFYSENEQISLYMTGNLGENWSQLDFNYEGEVIDASSKVNKAAVAIGNQEDNDAYVLESIDAGENWYLYKHFSNMLVDVDYLYENIIIAGNNADNGFVFDENGDYEYFNNYINDIVTNDNEVYEILVAGQEGAIYLRANSSLGIDNLRINQSSSNIEVFPNPVTTVFQISIPYKNRLPETVEIYDLQGRLVSTGYSDEKFNISQQPSGLYIIKLLSKNITGKILKK